MLLNHAPFSPIGKSFLRPPFLPVRPRIYSSKRRHYRGAGHITVRMIMLSYGKKTQRCINYTDLKIHTGK